MFPFLLLLVIVGGACGQYACGKQGFYDALHATSGTATFTCLTNTVFILDTSIEYNTANGYIYDITLDGGGRVTLDFTGHLVTLSGGTRLTLKNFIIRNGNPALSVYDTSLLKLEGSLLTGTSGGFGMVTMFGGELIVTRCSFYQVIGDRVIHIYGDNVKSSFVRTSCVQDQMAFCIVVGFNSKMADLSFDQCTFVGNIRVNTAATVRYSRSVMFDMYGNNVTFISGGYNFITHPNFHIAYQVTQQITDVYGKELMLGTAQKETNGILWYQPLTPGSPAINTLPSNSTPVTTDLIGRGMQNGAYDAGAVESDLYQGVYFDKPTGVVVEGSSTTTFPVELLKPYTSAVNVTVSYSVNQGNATNGVDYNNRVNTVTWEPGDILPKTVWVELLDPDYLLKPSRFIRIQVSSSTNFPATLLNNSYADITIQDNDQACGNNSKPVGNKCQCNSGYSGNNSTTGFGDCTDVNECTAGTHNCTNKVCNNTAGSFNCLECGSNTKVVNNQCQCLSGYSGSTPLNYNNCNDINECTTGTHNCSNEICTNTGGSFTCTACGSNTQIVNNQCQCQLGYSGSSPLNFGNCNDINECTAGTHNCSSTICTNTNGSFTCTSCGSNTQIINNQCQCRSGYSGNTPLNYGNCNDNNECTAGTHNCSNAVCDNTSGSFNCYSCGNNTRLVNNQCQCKPGYSGTTPLNYNSCSDIDECVTGTHNCTNLVCTNTAGSFECKICGGNAEVYNGQCQCKPGYYNGTIPLNNGSCLDINECEPPISHNCSVIGATCSNTIGGFNCSCNPGFIDIRGDGTDCAPIPTSTPSPSASPSPSPSPTQNFDRVDNNDGRGKNVGAIVGGVLGGIAALALIGILLFVLLNKRNKPQQLRSFETNKTGGHKRGKFGIEEFGSGYSSRDVKENSSMADSGL